MSKNASLEKVIELASGLMTDLESQAFSDARFAELSMRQMLYFNAIIRLKHPSFSELARELGVTKPSVTSIVGTLIQKGYVEKVQDHEDLRRFHIELTEKGAGFDRLHNVTHKRLAEILVAKLNEREVNQLGRLLGKALGTAKSSK
jgi:DNA-binding MarR family transcriptional regulator